MTVGGGVMGGAGQHTQQTNKQTKQTQTGQKEEEEKEEEKGQPHSHKQYVLNYKLYKIMTKYIQN